MKNFKMLLFSFGANIIINYLYKEFKKNSNDYNYDRANMMESLLYEFIYYINSKNN